MSSRHRCRRAPGHQAPERGLLGSPGHLSGFATTAPHPHLPESLASAPLCVVTPLTLLGPGALCPMAGLSCGHPQGLWPLPAPASPCRPQQRRDSQMHSPTRPEHPKALTQSDLLLSILPPGSHPPHTLSLARGEGGFLCPSPRASTDPCQQAGGWAKEQKPLPCRQSLSSGRVWGCGGHARPATVKHRATHTRSQTRLAC